MPLGWSGQGWIPREGGVLSREMSRSGESGVAREQDIVGHADQERQGREPGWESGQEGSQEDLGLWGRGLPTGCLLPGGL